VLMNSGVYFPCRFAAWQISTPILPQLSEQKLLLNIGIFWLKVITIITINFISIAPISITVPGALQIMLLKYIKIQFKNYNNKRMNSSTNNNKNKK